MKWSSGQEYKGRWVKDKQHGFGTLIHLDGDRYDGNFENDLFHGQGEMVYTTGEVYSGQWKLGFRTGTGT